MNAPASACPRGLTHPRRGGFSLIELVVSIVSVSIVMVAISSVILVATKALPNDTSPSRTALAATRCADDIAAELQYAQVITARSATSVEFIIPSTDTQNLPELIRYSWSGTPGDPILRRINNGADTVLLEDVHRFELEYDLVPADQYHPSSGESKETILVRHVGLSLPAVSYISSFCATSQYFLPALPPDATGWRVTRIRAWLTTASTIDGEAILQLQTPTVDFLPSGTVLEERTITEATLPAKFGLKEFTFYGIPELARNTGLCMVAKHRSGGASCAVLGDITASAPANTLSSISLTGGISWVPVPNACAVFHVYGTYSGSSQAPSVLCRVPRISLKIQKGDEPSALASAVIPILNRPEVIQ